MGADVVVIRPGREPSGLTDVAQTIFADSLKTRDIEALQKKSNVPELVDIAPAVIVPGNASYRGNTYHPTIFGWSAEFMGRIMGVYPERGEFFSEDDIRAKASVAVVGQKVVSELFTDGEDALGKSIRIKGRNFRIVGILPPKGQTFFGNIDELVIIPYSTAQTYLLGTDYYNEVMTRMSSPDVVARAVNDIKATLREQHNITDPSKDDFYVVTQQGVVDQVSTILNALTAFLSSVVAISLVVGGIGVMNIMLVSVTERTREIGLRKALGATDKDIRTQFLIEAVVLTGIGGLIGVGLGAGLAVIASFALSHVLTTSWEFTFPFSAAILGLGVSAAVGLLFGIYPARKASRKSPMEALRYE
jgi:putative ABC transport system permease protein